jgi:O-antigen ligase
MTVQFSEQLFVPRQGIEGAAPPTPAAPPAAAPAANPLGFALFIVVNAVLFIRPAEIVSDVRGWPIYEVVILLCAVVSLPGILAQLSFASLAQRPVTVFVLGMLVAVMVSHLAHLYIGGAYESGLEFSKSVLYYLLLVANLTTVARIRQFLFWLLAFVVVLSSLALLQYHEVIDIPDMRKMEEHDVDDDSGEVTLIPRLQSTGIYNDPNDLCLILLSGMAIAAYAIDSGVASLAPIWLGFLGLFGYALTLTQSRGGFVALVAGLIAYGTVRFGKWKAVLFAALVLPVAFALASGRQTNIDLGNRNDTAQARVQLWAEGLELFKRSPVFGIGHGEYAEEVKQVAHNSFVHCFTELGLFGGTIFIGAFACAIAGVRRGAASADSQARRLYPYILLIVTTYAFGMLSLSRQYIAPTYMVLGLAAAYTAVAAREPIRFSPALVGRIFALSLLVLAVTHLFVKIMTHMG